jgi:hypothetical protein
MESQRIPRIRLRIILSSAMSPGFTRPVVSRITAFAEKSMMDEQNFVGISVVDKRSRRAIF